MDCEQEVFEARVDMYASFVKSSLSLERWLFCWPQICRHSTLTIPTHLPPGREPLNITVPGHSDKLTLDESGTG